MRNPDLNYPRLTSLARRIKRTPTYIKSEDVKEWDLEDLLIWINQERAEHYETANMLAIANETTIDRSPFNRDLESLEQLVKTEIERRGRGEVAPKSKPAPPPDKPLPAFDDAISDRAKLPELWEALSLMDKPFLTSAGFVIGGEKARKHREIMALAQVIAAPLMGGRNQFEVYSMLCKRVGLKEHSRPGELPNNSGFDEIWRNIRTELSDLIK